MYVFWWNAFYISGIGYIKLHSQASNIWIDIVYRAKSVCISSFKVLFYLLPLSLVPRYSMRRFRLFGDFQWLRYVLEWMIYGYKKPGRCIKQMIIWQAASQSKTSQRVCVCVCVCKRAQRRTHRTDTVHIWSASLSLTGFVTQCSKQWYIFMVCGVFGSDWQHVNSSPVSFSYFHL